MDARHRGLEGRPRAPGGEVVEAGHYRSRLECLSVPGSGTCGSRIPVSHRDFGSGTDRARVPYCLLDSLWVRLFFVGGRQVGSWPRLVNQRAQDRGLVCAAAPSLRCGTRKGRPGGGDRNCPSPSAERTAVAATSSWETESGKCSARQSCGSVQRRITVFLIKSGSWRDSDVVSGESAHPAVASLARRSVWEGIDAEDSVVVGLPLVGVSRFRKTTRPTESPRPRLGAGCTSTSTRCSRIPTYGRLSKRRLNASWNHVRQNRPRVPPETRQEPAWASDGFSCRRSVGTGF